ncbi:MAG: hypothetical protein HYT30_01495 [Parcubacteria group bacterium]|nr:hypothetical protein [Parcubacteria group bacterium]
MNIEKEESMMRKTFTGAVLAFLLTFAPATAQELGDEQMTLVLSVCKIKDLTDCKEIHLQFMVSEVQCQMGLVASDAEQHVIKWFEANPKWTNNPGRDPTTGRRGWTCRTPKQLAAERTF